SRIAEDRLPCSRVWSISPINSVSLAPWTCAIYLKSLQKASSRLTLVLRPLTTTERFTIKDVIGVPLLAPPTLLPSYRFKFAPVQYFDPPEGTSVFFDEVALGRSFQ